MSTGETVFTVLFYYDRDFKIKHRRIQLYNVLAIESQELLEAKLRTLRTNLSIIRKHI